MFIYFRCSNDENQKNNPDYSGFYKYHVPTNSWTCILTDTFHEIKVQDGLLTHNPQTVASRGGHSLLLHSVCFYMLYTNFESQKIYFITN